NELAAKIKIAAVAKLGAVKRPLRQPGSLKLTAGGRGLVVAIGASTGGTEAIASVVQEFPEDMPGVVIVQHMPAGFTEMYAKRLDEKCRMHVKEARTGDEVVPGQVLLAPGGDSHMQLVKVNGSYQVVLKKAPKVNGHCPSVDVLFDSVAKNAGDRAVGIILTGMGGDGAKGLLAMRQAGAVTIGQDESTCVVYGMPKVAYELGAVTYQEKLQDIAGRTNAIINRK
ncbi:MAG: CheB methylesterase domain-containing protein, partial [Roseburia sp.]